MLKVDVATYLLNNLSNRFPIKNEEIVDQDLIGAVVDRWAMKKFLPASTHMPFSEDAPAHINRTIQ